MKNVSVSMTGCALADCLYTHIDFASEAFRRYSSRKPGDGGLVPGQLTFLESLEKFSGDSGEVIMDRLSNGEAPAARNIGGPAIVAAVNAAQLCCNVPVSVRFYGRMGNDETGKYLAEAVRRTPVDVSSYRVGPGASPSTQVLSDPSYHDGKGERTFVNVIGAANGMTPAALDDRFYAADILGFFATALLPEMHDNLTGMLKRGHDAGKINMVATVFDFRNEMRDPVGRWPLGESDETYKYIDLLAVDWDEARRMSGEESLESIMGFFATRGVSSVFITHGAKDFYLYSDGKLFTPCPVKALPVNETVNEDMRLHPEWRGDTTGCGDNFAGGLLTSLALQLAAGKKPGELDWMDAAAWAGACGGFACFCVGGTYFEKERGEKYAKVVRYHDAYFLQK